MCPRSQGKHVAGQGIDPAHPGPCHSLGRGAGCSFLPGVVHVGGMRLDICCGLFLHPSTDLHNRQRPMLPAPSGPGAVGVLVSAMPQRGMCNKSQLCCFESQGHDPQAASPAVSWAMELAPCPFRGSHVFVTSGSRQLLMSF